MKHIILAILLMLSTGLAAQIAEQPLGAGSADNPYQIANFNNLLWITQTPGYWGLHYIQTGDIDASISSELDSGAGWLPIGRSAPWFTGTYDGQGFVIQGLYFSRGTTWYTGLFGIALNAKLNRIHLTNINYLGSVYHGGLAGVAQNSVINNCSTSGSVRGSSDVGGLVGFVNYSTVITNSYSHASVQGNSNVGGFIGQNGFDNGFIYRCFSTGLLVNGSASYQGGFVGRHSGGSVYSCFWDTQSSGIATDPMANPRNTSEMKSQSNYIMWNFDTQWSILEGVSYPNLQPTAAWQLPSQPNLGDLSGAGTELDPYLIDSAAKLNVLRLSPSSHFKLTTDIDLSDTVVWNHGQGWLAVGDAGSPFTGVLDGNGKRLQNLAINQPQTNYTGLFGYTQGATLTNLRIDNAMILAKNYCGSLVAYAVGGSITDVSVNGTLVAQDYSGGVVGHLDGGILLRSKSLLSMRSSWLSQTGHYKGGLAGLVSNTGLVESCSSSGSIDAGWNLGGIVGALSWGLVSNCYSRMSINGGRNIGGVIGVAGGSNPGNINRCYATGEIELTSGGSFSGGVVGYLSDGSIMNQSFWDIQTTGIPNDLSNNGRTTAQMTYPGSETTFAAWDFDDIWRHDSTGLQNNGYPYLAWQEQTIPDAVQNLVISQNEAVIILSWSPVPGIDSYIVYATEDPYLPLSQWAYLGMSNTAAFSTAAGARLFFVVKAVQMP